MKNKFTKIFTFIISLVLVISAGCFLLEKYREPGDVSISVHGTTVKYEGDIHKGAYELFTRKVRSEKIEKLVINSGGGDTVYGRLIGEYVFDNEIDVVVEELCFSSCANYIFPAGKMKYIMEDAVVAWHGSETQFTILARLNGNTTEAYLRESMSKALDEASLENGSSMSEEEKESIVNDTYLDFMEEIELEAAFFDKIGVDKNVTLDGLEKLEKLHEENPDSTIRGWTFSIADMQKYGLTDITYLSGRDYPARNEFFNRHIFLLKSAR